MARLKSPHILLHTNNKIFTLSAYTNNFTPYIGLNIGANIADYTTDIKQSKNYYSGTITAGARISKTFGAELFYPPLNTEFINTISEFSIGARYNF